MFIQLDQSSDIPLYQQLRNQIVAAIATGELAPGDGLRDEGYLVMRGRAGASVATPPGEDAALKRLSDGLALLVAEFKAAGGARQAFEEAVRTELDTAYGAVAPKGGEHDE